MTTVIIPHLNRVENLVASSRAIQSAMRFIKHEVLVVEQVPSKPFCKGTMCNIGTLHANPESTHYIFYDVDLIPVNVDFSKCPNPTSMADRFSLFKDWTPYELFFGGCTQFPKAAFAKVNGFSNKYKIWGGEDDDIRLRCVKEGLKVDKRPGCFYHMPHPKLSEQGDNTKRFDDFRFGKVRHWDDGLNKLKYELIDKQLNKFLNFQHLFVDNLC